MLKPTKNQSKSLSPLSLAMSNQYGKIDWGKLTEEDISRKTQSGHTLLHYCAKDGYWKKLPTKLKQKKYWTQSSDGETVPLIAMQGIYEGQFNFKTLKTEDLLIKTSQKQSVATLACRKGCFHYLPKDIITLEVLSEPIEFNDQDTILHRLARSARMSVVPKQFLTPQTLSNKGRYGETIYHILTEGKIYSLIPKEQWTKKNLTLQSDNGVTPLHNICQHNPEIIPKDVTLEDLLIPSSEGTTAFHCWAASSKWADIPEKFLSKKSLEMETKSEQSPISLIIWQARNISKEDDPKAHTKLKLMLQKISAKILKNLYQKAPQNEILTKMLKQEMFKRKLLEKMSDKSQCFEI
jgi:hypothetical protein